MKNLELLNLKRNCFSNTFENVSHIIINDEIMYFLKNKYLYSYNINSGIEEQLSPLEYNCITSLVFLSFEKQLWFGTGKEMIFYSLHDETLNSIPLVDSFEAAVWNPTEDTLAVVFSNGNVETYSFNLNTCESYSKNKSVLSSNVPGGVYVGWGSEKTQFRGSEGKFKVNANKEDEEVHVEDKTPKISWRGNGEMFVVNYWENEKRTFKVFDEQCTPLFKAETTIGLQALIAWRPVGNMIACPVVSEGKNKILIFEKNGCKRFSFNVSNLDKIENICWTPNGEILLIHQKKSNNTDLLTLYISSNYKWYIKQQLLFPLTHKLISYEWINTTRDLFAIKIFTINEIIIYTFKSVVHRSLFDDDFTACAVIDGSKLCLTYFGEKNLPPPMSDVIIQLDYPINFVTFNINNSILAAIDSNYNVIFYNYKKREVIKKLQLQTKDNLPLCINHFYWYKNCLTYFVLNKNLVVYTLGNTEEYLKTIKNDLNSIYLIPKTDNEVYLYSHKACLNENVIVDVKSTIMQLSGKKIEDTNYLFLLTNLKEFYINDTMISNNVTSFITHNNYLLLTTTFNRLYCVRLIQKEIESLCNGVNLEKEFYSRSIEQSATIICATLNSPSVILQMPRGNIEIISCRLIAIDILENMLQENKWNEAVYFIRNERLNINLLIDLNPSRFIENIENFVAATKNPSVLSSICQDIVDDNVLSKIYPKCAIKNIEILNNKCKLICKKILEHLEEIDYAAYITTIIIIYIHHFTIEEALVYVQDLLHRSTDVIKQAINTLKIYIDEKILYQKALSLYDIDLTLLIANNLQMDPCEYEPFLMKLKLLSEVERRFEINKLLGNYKTAAQYLIRTPGVTDYVLIQFAKKHNVIQFIYPCIPTNSITFVSISKIYGSELHSKGCFNESAAVYARADLWREAYDEYKLALNWKRALYAMSKMNLNESECEKYIGDIGENLVRKNRIVEASQVFEEYSKNYEAAIRILYENAYFVEAIRIAQKYHKNEIIETDIADAIKKYGLTLTKKIKEIDENFNNYTNRLLILRNEKLEACKNRMLGLDDYDNENDLYSDTQSQSTRLSTVTSGSRSTIKRRLKRKAMKKESLRVGGVYEDIALIKTLYNLIVDAFTLSPNVRGYCLLCLEFKDLYNDVKYLHNMLVNLQETIMQKIEHIWLKSFHNCENADANIEEIAINENIIELDVKYRCPPMDVIHFDWKLKIFD